MEEINFAALAPRQGTKPLIGAWSNIGTSEMNGGAFNWGSLLSGLKVFGNAVKDLGRKALNSSTGQALKQKLKDTNLQEKIVEGISSGIHGAVDIANQEIQKTLAKRLDPVHTTPSPLDVLEETEEKDFSHVSLPPITKKRKVEESYDPPSYNEIYGKEVVLPSTNVNTPKTYFPPSQRNWQTTLNNIVGVGVNFSKKRRCY
ncbi:pVI [Bat mastadenovirus WIV13]|uniref:PVI n=1 Tax=Bat mastadenovirus WIV13 TaxID=1788435 RepID=A0A1B0UHX0_9ADEN|nr:pVI [Bat mastadenovirus WIV13]AMB43030.1 pVI [Bat mastadenovirus WIV13]